MPSFSLEKQHQVPVIGVDEAGRGPWAGPVVVAAVVFYQYNTLPEWVDSLNDSKKLTALRREKLFEFITQAREGLLSYHIETIDVATIDRVNILEATMMGMRQCIQSLWQNKAGCHVLVDGNRQPFQKSWCETVVKGDSISTSIAAASILAKVSRDRLMEALAKEYPGYGWESNAGYGTVKHQDALKRLGVTLHHRKSFAPIKRMCV